MGVLGGAQVRLRGVDHNDVCAAGRRAVGAGVCRGAADGNVRPGAQGAGERGADAHGAGRGEARVVGAGTTCMIETFRKKGIYIYNATLWFGSCIVDCSVVARLCAGDVRSLARLAVEDVVAKVGGVGRGVDCGRQWCVS